MMASNEGLALKTKALGADVSELKELYRKLLGAIERGQLELARHLMNTIDTQQSKHPGLSDAAQEAFDRLAIAASTEDVVAVRAALEAFRSVLRSSSSLPPSSGVRASAGPSAELVEASRPSGLMPRFRFEEYSVEAFDQELPETASLFAVEREW